uniref:Uncharacterized protein n=1 Tax=Rhizophora mucronata TaxID=61149 RepID=A0A2P2MXU9_RHIMU
MIYETFSLIQFWVTIFSSILSMRSYCPLLEELDFKAK